MRYKQWKIAHPSPAGRAQLERAGIPSLLACVLSARGVTEPEQAWKLLTPGEEPLLACMDRDVEGVYQAEPPDVYKRLFTNE